MECSDKKSPPAGSDFALRATQGQSRLFITALHLLHNQFMRKGKACVGRRLSNGTGPKSFLESPYSFSKNFMWERGRATQGQSQLLAVPIASPKTLCARRERPALDAGRKGRVWKSTHSALFINLIIYK